MPGLLETLEGIQYEHDAHEKLAEETYLRLFKACLFISQSDAYANFNRHILTASQNTLTWWRPPSILLHSTHIRTLSSQITTRVCKGWPLNSWRYVRCSDATYQLIGNIHQARDCLWTPSTAPSPKISDSTLTRNCAWKILRLMDIASGSPRMYVIRRCSSMPLILYSRLAS